MPTASGTGSVPGRRPCCWSAEEDRLERDVVADQQGSDAQRALKLVGGNAHGGQAQAAEIERQFARHGDGVAVQGHAAPLQRAASSATGCTTPVS